MSVELVWTDAASRNTLHLTRATWSSRLRSDEKVTPRTRTRLLGATVSWPSFRDGPLLPNTAAEYLEPAQSSSVFSAFSLRRFAAIQWLAAVRQRSSRSTTDVGRPVSKSRGTLVYSRRRSIHICSNGIRRTHCKFSQPKTSRKIGGTGGRMIFFWNGWISC